MLVIGLITPVMLLMIANPLQKLLLPGHRVKWRLRAETDPAASKLTVLF